MQENSNGKQRTWRNCRGDFSVIFLPSAGRDQGVCLPMFLVQALMLAAGVLGAVLMVFIFWALLQSLDMQCTVATGRHSSGCPEQSCFCADCDPCNLYLQERHTWQWQDFQCHMFGLLPMNRCRLALLLNLWWLGVTLRMAGQVIQALQRDVRHASARRRTLWLVLVVCCLSTVNSISLPWSWLSQNMKLIAKSLIYNVINTCLLASGISVFFQTLAARDAQPEPHCCGPAFDMLAWYFLRSFLLAAFAGELFVVVFARSTESREEFVEQENEFYLMFLVLGVLVAWSGFKAAGTSRHEQLKLRRVVFKLFFVKLFWLSCRCAQWGLMCSRFYQFATKYNLIMLLLERLCTLQTLHLLKEFTLRPFQRAQLARVVNLHADEA